MRKLDLYWKSNRDWWYLDNYANTILKEDAPEEAKKSYQNYKEELKRIIELEGDDEDEE